MILASLVNIQKKRRVEKMPKGTMRRREREHLVRSSENVRIKSSEGTSHQPYGKCHVAGEGETLSPPLPPGVDQSPSQRQGQVNGMIVPGIAKTLKASPA